MSSESPEAGYPVGSSTREAGFLKIIVPKGPKDLNNRVPLNGLEGDT